MTRRILSLLAIIFLSSLAGVATPQGAPEEITSAAVLPVVPTLPRAPQPASSPSPVPSASGMRAALVEPAASRNPLVAPTLQGTWSYADPAYGPHYLAIPNGPGWRVTICGSAMCLDRVSTDAGPVLSLQREGRIGDLSAVMFETLCAMTPAQRKAVGLCPGSFTITGRIKPPDTDAKGDPS